VLFDPGEDFKLTHHKKVNRLEREANAFASHLLVPEDMLARIVSGYGAANITMISRVFGISFTAAYFRLLNGGFIEAAQRPILQLRREDESEFKRLQFDYVPNDVAPWKMLRMVMSGSDMMHRNCLRCKNSNR